MQNTSAVKWVIPFFVHKHNVDIASAKGIKHRQTEMEKPIFCLRTKTCCETLEGEMG